jgi:hypothetical protein
MVNCLACAFDAIDVIGLAPPFFKSWIHDTPLRSPINWKKDHPIGDDSILLLSSISHFLHMYIPQIWIKFYQ